MLDFTAHDQDSHGQRSFVSSPKYGAAHLLEARPRTLAASVRRRHVWCGVANCEALPNVASGLAGAVQPSTT